MENPNSFAWINPKPKPKPRAGAKKVMKKRGNYNICSKEIKIEAIRLAHLRTSKEASEILSIPEKNIKRWMKNGPDRKKGAGRKTMDPNMEQQLLDWIQKILLVDNLPFPESKDIKAKAKEYSSNPSFKASKGWCDKFIKRNSYFFERLKSRDPILLKQMKLIEDVQESPEKSVKENEKKSASWEKNAIFVENSEYEKIPSNAVAEVFDVENDTVDAVTKEVLLNPQNVMINEEETKKRDIENLTSEVQTGPKEEEKRHVVSNPEPEQAKGQAQGRYLNPKTLLEIERQLFSLPNSRSEDFVEMLSDPDSLKPEYHNNALRVVWNHMKNIPKECMVFPSEVTDHHKVKLNFQKTQNVEYVKQFNNFLELQKKLGPGAFKLNVATKTLFLNPNQVFPQLAFGQFFDK